MTEGQWADHHAEHLVTGTTIPKGNRGNCRICEEVAYRVKHHISYEPEETILICKSCHSKIHLNDDFHPELTPDEVPEGRQYK